MFDGTCDVDDRGVVTLRADDDGKNGIDGYVIKGKVLASAVDASAVEAGANVRVGHVRVYVDEQINGASVERASTDTVRHQFVNRNFKKKFTPPTRGTAATGGERTGAPRGDGRENEQNERSEAADVVMVGSKGLGAFARMLQQQGGDLDAAAERAAASAAAESRITMGPNVVNTIAVKPVVVPPKRKSLDSPPPVKARAVTKVRAAPVTLSTEVNVAFPAHDYEGVVVERASSFASVRAYQSYFVGALCENMTARLKPISKVMHAYRLETKSSSSGAVSLDVIAKIMRQKYNMYYFAKCELRSRTFTPKGESVSRAVMHLEVSDFKSYKSKPNAYAMGDLWIVSTDPMFETAPPNAVGDRNRAPWIGVVECLWHGPSKDGKFECRLLSPRPVSLRDNSTMQVYAIHSFNGRGELDEVRNVSSLSNGRPPPLMDSLLGKSPPVELKEEENLYFSDPDTGIEALQRRFKLNDDQARAVSGALASAKSMSQVPIRLIHGPFGSGKTHTIAAFVIKAASCLKAQKGRILISANTNVAVDRVLTALLAAGFRDFIRVGSVRKIDAGILPYSLHVKTGKGKTQVKELEAMLTEATSSRSRAILKQEIAALTSGKLVMRRALLKKCSVVGVTCTSSCNEELQGMNFTVVVLDECSQMTETSSLLPIVKSRCQTLVAVGDPKQLPPVLECFTEAKGDSNLTRNPLSTTLFSRMSEVGHSKVTLRTQYRLHPTLAAVPNACFYDGILLDGVSADDRRSLINLENGCVLPPILWWDTNGADQRDGGSRYNVTEAERVSCIVQCLLRCGISAREIGVIAPYVAQAHLLITKFSNISAIETDVKLLNDDDDDDDSNEPESFLPSDVQISTVDAFQGQEKEIIILTLCGSPASNFITDERINVALTRAKRHLIVVGAAMVAQRSGMRAWSDTLVRARSTANSYVPSGALTDEVLRKWSPAMREKGEHAVDLSQSSSETEMSQRFLMICDALIELKFDQKMYWEFYCAVMRGTTYDHEQSRTFVMSSPLIPLIRRTYPKLVAADGSLAWHQAKVKRILTQDVLQEYRRFIELEYGPEWGTLEKLVATFEDREEFLNDPTGFGWLCAQDANAEAENLAQAATWAATDFVPPEDDSTQTLSQDSWDV